MFSVPSVLFHRSQLQRKKSDSFRVHWFRLFFLHPVNYNQRPSIQYSWEVKRCADSLKRISKRTDLNQLLNFLTVQTLFISPLYAHSLLSVFLHGYSMWTHFVVTGGVRVSFSLSVLTANSLFPPWLRHFTDRQKTSGLCCKYPWRRKMREEGETGRYHCHTERLWTLLKMF